jgi:uncharacterized membrane protein YsdA (DUF1294 family)/cold shock CspA family protein
MTGPPTTLTGELTRWDDDRGFGFLTPLGGGAEVFLHISALPRSSARPKQGDLLNYVVERTENGKRRAARVEMVRTTSTARRPPRAPRRTGGTRSRSSQVFGVLVALAIAGLFFAGLFVKDDRWSVPQWAVLSYLAASILCFISYSVDKSAAVAGRWRTPEATLLGLGLIGGWPGALLAQQMFRHKIRKRPFMRVFAGTVVANIAVLVLIVTPMGATAVCTAVRCG